MGFGGGIARLAFGSPRRKRQGKKNLETYQCDSELEPPKLPACIAMRSIADGFGYFLGYLPAFGGQESNS